MAEQLKEIPGRPTRCIDPVMKYCQGCPHGCIIYPEWVETVEDTYWSGFETTCVYNLEDTEPTQEEIDEFERWCNDVQQRRIEEADKYAKEHAEDNELPL